MKTRSFEVTGPKEGVDRLRQELLAECQPGRFPIELLNESKQVPIEIMEPVSTSVGGGENQNKVRQVDMAEVMLVFAIHIPAGVVAHAAYDWLRAWLKERSDAAQTRVREIAQPEDPPDAKP